MRISISVSAQTPSVERSLTPMKPQYAFLTKIGDKEDRMDAEILDNSPVLPAKRAQAPGYPDHGGKAVGSFTVRALKDPACKVL